MKFEIINIISLIVGENKENVYKLLRSAKNSLTQNVYRTKDNICNTCLTKNKAIVLLSGCKNPSVVILDKVSLVKHKLMNWLTML